MATRLKMKNKAYSNISIIITILFLLVTIILPYKFVSEEIVNDVMDRFFKDLGHIFNEDMSINVFSLFFNNLRASFIMMVIGWIPLLFLPLLTLGINGLIIGIALKMTSLTGINPLKMLVLGIVPHGIFEIPALLISFLLGVFICKNISKRIFRGDTFYLRDVFLFTIKEFVIKVIPLLIIAAIIESYITPLIMFKFL